MIGKKMRKKIDELHNILATEGAIDEGKFLQGVEDLIFQSAPVLLRDRSVKNWKFIKDTRQEKFFLPSELEIVPFLDKRENSTTGTTLMSWARKMRANFGYMQLRYLLKHRKKMPAEWNEYIFVFPGTILCDDLYNFRIPYLYPIICESGRRFPSGYLFYDQPLLDPKYRLLRAIE